MCLNGDSSKCTGESEMYEISEYLTGMETAGITNLGLALGLKYTRLKNNSNSPTFLLETIHGWLQKQDNVKETPTWRTLVNALDSKGVGQKGIADKIAKDKCIHN